MTPTFVTSETISANIEKGSGVRRRMELCSTSCLLSFKRCLWDESVDTSRSQLAVGCGAGE